MYTRHDEVPVFHSFDKEVPANYYNHVQKALKRLGDSIRLQIPELRHLDLILQKDAWIVVDRILNDVPVVAWTAFNTGNRETIHEPIECRILFFHANGAMILRRTLEAMELMLGEELDEYNPDDESQVIPFNKDKPTE